MRRWEQLPNLHRLVLTHEGHTIACSSVADARILCESVNRVIEELEAVTLPRQPALPLTEEQLERLMRAHVIDTTIGAAKEQHNA